MSYTPTEWSNGDIITAEKLNKLESGVQGALEYKEIFVVKVNIDASITPSEIPVSTTADKTFTEIKEAYEAGKIIKIYGVQSSSSMTTIREFNTVTTEMNGELGGVLGTFIAEGGTSNGILNSVSSTTVMITSAGVQYAYNRGQWTPMQ